jgi:hypothetical protein
MLAMLLHKEPPKKCFAQKLWGSSTEFPYACIAKPMAPSLLCRIESPFRNPRKGVLETV